MESMKRISNVDRVFILLAPLPIHRLSCVRSNGCNGSPWVFTEAKSSGKPKYKKDNLNSDLILNSVIPTCKDAKGDEGCY